MSSVSGRRPDEVWAFIGRILLSIENMESRGIVEAWLQERQAAGLKPSTLVIHANALRGFARSLGTRSLREATRADVIGYVNNAKSTRTWRARQRDGTVRVTKQEGRLGPRTLAQRKEVLRPFFRWLRGTEDDAPPETKGLRVKRVEDMLPTDALVTRDDLTKLIQAHMDVQSKARIAVLYESGFRAGEFCALNVGSVQFDELEPGLWSVVVTLPKGVPGLKTGSRRIRLYDSVEYLRRWIDEHPKRSDYAAPLWLTNSWRAPLARISPGSLGAWCERAARKAGIQKSLNPHVWRHSAATERARLGWNEPQMRAYFGWTRSSDMPSLYTHLAGVDCDDMEIARRGIRRTGRHHGPALQALTCKYCSQSNVATATFCQRCKRAISPDAEAEIQKRKDAAFLDQVQRLLGNASPEAIEVFARQANELREAGA